jgi:pimeloyl-ACP methyl ester carboxylesterase
MSSPDWDDQRPILVMVHGAGGSSEVWRSQIYGLSRVANAIALDLPGHGKSTGPGMDSIEAYCGFVCGLIEDIFSQPVFLMGHSMGGAITQAVASTRPDLLRGIILASTGPRLKVAPQFLKGLLEDFEATVERFLGYAYAQEAPKELVREGIRLMKEAGSRVVHDDLAACDRFDSRAMLQSIKSPCLVVCGEKDLLTPPSLSEKLKAGIAGSSLRIIQGAGHTVMIERPGPFNEAVAEFLGESM